MFKPCPRTPAPAASTAATAAPTSCAPSSTPCPSSIAFSSRVAGRCGPWVPGLAPGPASGGGGAASGARPRRSHPRRPCRHRTHQRSLQLGPSAGLARPMRRAPSPHAVALPQRRFGSPTHLGGLCSSNCGRSGRGPANKPSCAARVPSALPARYGGLPPPHHAPGHP